MKKFTALLLAFIMPIFALVGCSSEEEPSQVIKGYSDSKAFADGEDGSRQELTKYFYDQSFDSKFAENKEYAKVTKDNKEEITGYIQNFDDWAKYSTFKNDYDFGADKIKEGDYFVIADKSISNDNLGVRKVRTAYKMYYLFYYQTESHTLYHIYMDITT